MDAMVHSLPITDVHGRLTPFTLDLAPNGDGFTLTIPGDFAGRDVEEEVDRPSLERLVAEDGFDYRDLLGLTLTTDGEVIRGLVGVGSGNERFTIERSALASALQ